MIVTDLAGVAAVQTSEPHARRRQYISQPLSAEPIALGAHIVIHSMTKYLNGHSDCIGGAVVLTRQEDADKIYFLQRAAGAGLARWIVSDLRGIKTLAVRNGTHDSNGRAIAKFLENHSKVNASSIPGSRRTHSTNSQTPAARLRRHDHLRRRRARCSPTLSTTSIYARSPKAWAELKASSLTRPR